MVYQSSRLYPDLRIYTELKSDIKIPVFAEALFQSLQELIKNAAQAIGLSFYEEVVQFNREGEKTAIEKKAPAAKIETQKTPPPKKLHIAEKKNSFPSEVTIRTFRKENKWFCCEVEDKGPGMDRNTMEKACQLYFTTKKNSIGLGLVFVQSALSRIGGLMKLQSNSLEKSGLKICLFIPLDYIMYIQALKSSSQKKTELTLQADYEQTAVI